MGLGWYHGFSPSGEFGAERNVRTIYSLAIYLLVPLLLLHLAFRGLRNRQYLSRWSERFAIYRQPTTRGGIVVHAVSVGEVNAAASLIRALQKKFPERPLTVTSFTPTGSERVSAIFGHSVGHCYLPIDLPGAVRRFFDHVDPSLVVIMETEIWPNLYFEAARRDIPLMISNARISDHSIGGYRRLHRLTRAALAQVACIAAQSELDASRLLEMGANRDQMVVLGNLKYDLNLPDELAEKGLAYRQSWGLQRPVFLAGSTHEGDEGPVLDAFKIIREAVPDCLLVLVPRHPERFERAAQHARSRGLNVVLHSANPICSADDQCYVVDTMGELLQFYAACDVAFVGGSFDRTGGHNVLEPAALGKPVLVGPNTFTFEEITSQLLASGGALRVMDADELARQVIRLLGDEATCSQMGQAGLALVKSGQGALKRTLDIAAKLLSSQSG